MFSRSQIRGWLRCTYYLWWHTLWQYHDFGLTFQGHIRLKLVVCHMKDHVHNLQVTYLIRLSWRGYELAIWANDGWLHWFQWNKGVAKGAPMMSRWTQFRSIYDVEMNTRIAYDVKINTGITYDVKINTGSTYDVEMNTRIAYKGAPMMLRWTWRGKGSPCRRHSSCRDQRPGWSSPRHLHTSWWCSECFHNCPKCHRTLGKCCTSLPRQCSSPASRGFGVGVRAGRRWWLGERGSK